MKICTLRGVGGVPAALEKNEWNVRTYCTANELECSVHKPQYINNEVNRA
jgi:hypothetical protein